jgi:hypothetical protein
MFSISYPNSHGTIAKGIKAFKANVFVYYLGLQGIATRWQGKLLLARVIRSIRVVIKVCVHGQTLDIV